LSLLLSVGFHLKLEYPEDFDFENLSALELGQQDVNSIERNIDVCGDLSSQLVLITTQLTESYKLAKRSTKCSFKLLLTMDEPDLADGGRGWVAWFDGIQAYKSLVETYIVT
jgi:hypothetical protein